MTMPVDSRPPTSGGLRWLLASIVSAVAAFLIMRHLTAPARASAEVFGDWSSLHVDGKALDEGSRPITMVVFTDFFCDYCIELEQQVRSLPTEIRDSVKLFIRHFPLRGAQSVHAAKAMECTPSRLERKRLHDFIVSQVMGKDSVDWNSTAIASALRSPQSVLSCAEDSRADSLLTSDIAAGRALRVRGTPTFLIDSVVYRGIGAEFSLERALRSALRRRR